MKDGSNADMTIGYPTAHLNSNASPQLGALSSGRAASVSGSGVEFDIISYGVGLDIDSVGMVSKRCFGILDPNN